MLAVRINREKSPSRPRSGCLLLPSQNDEGYSAESEVRLIVHFRTLLCALETFAQTVMKGSLSPGGIHPSPQDIRVNL